ncbi:MAG: hypothetical protein JNM17_37840 [Archangium sp.]|nr:hypothetical protein [Archangium sp.]
MSLVRHDQIFAVLEQLHSALENRDALRAEELMVQAVDAVSSTPDAAKDERLVGLLRKCDQLATAFHAELARAMQGTAKGSRAARSYAQADAESVP